MGEKMMQSNLTKTLKDGAIYEKDTEDCSFATSGDRTGLAVGAIADRSILCTETFYNATKY